MTARCLRSATGFVALSMTKYSIVVNKARNLMKVPLSGKYGQGKFALIDDEDAYLLVGRRVCVDGTSGYAIVSVNNSSRTLQRYLLSPADYNVYVDHVNHDKLDCRRSNLRLVTPQQSTFNRRTPRHNRSGYLGVFWNRQRDRYMARIVNDGKSYYLGLYADPRDAALAYDKKARELRGEYAYTNF